MEKRSTIQKSLISSAVLSMDNHPTADEIYAEVLKRCPNISKGTVYRNLNQLAESGEILRVQVANAPDRYDHTLGDHSHFYCRSCGKVYDYQLQTPVLPQPDLNPELQVLTCDVIFSGYCSSCQQKEE